MNSNEFEILPAHSSAAVSKPPIARPQFLALALALSVLAYGCGSDLRPADAWPFGRESSSGDVSKRCVQLERADDESGSCESAGEEVPTTEACGMELFGTREQFEQTPRARPGLEAQLLRATEQFILSKCRYRRWSGEIRAIFDEFGEVVGKSKLPDAIPGSGAQKRLTVELSSKAMQKVREDDAQRWSCLADHFEATEQRVGDVSVGIVFEGIYDMERVAQNYDQLAGVVDAEAFPVTGGSFDICMERRGGANHYVFVSSWGDCTLGCTAHRAEYFVVQPDGRSCREDAFTYEPSKRDRPLSEVAPEWWTICDG